MQDSTHRKFLGGAVLFALTILSGSHAALAQAHSTASKTADISVFGGYTYSNPDFGPTNNAGISAGVDYTRYYGWIVAPSIEVRGVYTTGDLVTQKTALVGLRFKADFRHFHPYADALFGGTSLNFKIPPNPSVPTYLHDVAFTTSYGGGVDIDIIRNFQAKVDYQLQSSNYGANGTVPGNGDFKLTPTEFTVGVVYRLSFKRYR